MLFRPSSCVTQRLFETVIMSVNDIFLLAQHFADTPPKCRQSRVMKESSSHNIGTNVDKNIGLLTILTPLQSW